MSILTRTAILIYPYLLRLGLPTGSLLRIILIRTSFILIYWREVSKFQTLHSRHFHSLMHDSSHSTSNRSARAGLSFSAPPRPPAHHATRRARGGQSSHNTTIHAHAGTPDVHNTRTHLHTSPLFWDLAPAPLRYCGHIARRHTMETFTRRLCAAVYSASSRKPRTCRGSRPCSLCASGSASCRPSRCRSACR